MKHHKKFRILLFALFFFFLGQATISANPNIHDVQDGMLDDISLEGVQKYWGELVQDYGGYLPELEKTSVYEFIKDQGSFSLKNTLIGLVEFLFHELLLNGKLLGSLFMLTLFSIMLQTMHNAFEKSTVSKIAYFVVYIVLIFLALNSFYSAVSYAKDAIDTMSSFMIALLPLVLGLMATFGNVVAVSFFHPIIIFLIHACGLLISTFILPLLFLSALLIIVSSLNENYKVTHLANLFKTVSLGALGIFLTIFLSVMSVQGAASAIQDGVAMKTAKFITGNFIPVVGRTFTDAADTILSASLLLKNAIGIVGVLIILFIALFPALKIFAIAIIYKIAAAVLQPIGDGPVITTLNTISKYIVFILACLLAVSFMFFLAIVIIVVASNLTLLLR
ncbi:MULTISPECIES: stage III sporulation protein AE [Virgibacillus]|uniref:Stage III sporulation protein AE n=1 Tax=Virgibacillus salarius TaxID=447199 RepID=A0A941DU72_9BACI|nr:MULTISPECIES: stage III sporulation protein AE [Bacillaceae]MBR7796750.1 stage III sporulation protein AE [Virgibacillus salarius]NAZ09460.1 stage III sporulation protein AE [Agaribacter marinus]WBX79174.1 stage III sporulation protein AE [Virgibacillus salarius]